jgi:hypothetical protein
MAANWSMKAWSNIYLKTCVTKKKSPDRTFLHGEVAPCSYLYNMKYKGKGGGIDKTSLSQHITGKHHTIIIHPFTLEPT